MPTPESLSGHDFQAIYDRAVANAGQPEGPFSSPEDWRDQWIYFLMVDRFNNPAADPKHHPFDDPNFDRYQGGTYSGVREQLGYITELGAGAIWLSPVLENMPFDAHSYHGYGIHDFLRAERRFADSPNAADDELRALVDAAHRAGLYVIFDIVLNHVGDVFAYACDPLDRTCQDSHGSKAGFHPEPMTVMWRDAAGTAQPGDKDIAAIALPSRDAVVWPKELQQNAFSRRQGVPAPHGDDTVGDFDSLKQMMTATPALQSFLIRAYQYVIARFDVDGFRIDTLRYLKGGLPRLFGNAIREFALSIGKKNFFIFGEVLDSSEERDIARFIGRSTQDGSDLVGVDAALDYPLFNVLKPTVKGFSPPTAIAAMYNLRKSVEENILSSHGDATRFFVTFLDNHDMKERVRFIDRAGQQAQDDEVTLGLACLLGLPGIPCIYYGTEQGLHGRGSDPAVREALWGGPKFPRDNPFYVAIKTISAVRAGQPALRYGRFYLRPISGDGHNFGVSPFNNGVLAFSRILNDAEVVVVANTNKTTPMSPHVIVEEALNPVGKEMRVLYSNKPRHSSPQAVETRSNVLVKEVDGTTGTGPLRTIQVSLQPTEVQILR
jgi:glycosidase